MQTYRSYLIFCSCWYLSGWHPAEHLVEQYADCPADHDDTPLRCARERPDREGAATTFRCRWIPFRIEEGPASSSFVQNIPAGHWSSRLLKWGTVNAEQSLRHLALWHDPEPILPVTRGNLSPGMGGSAISKHYGFSRNACRKRPTHCRGFPLGIGARQ